MKHFLVPAWTSVVIVLAGVWSALVPFAGSLLNPPSPVMGHAAMGSMSMTVISGTTLAYHVIPGGITILIGLYQLVGERLRKRSAGRRPSIATELANG